MVQYCREIGLEVSPGDGIEHIKSLPDSSLRGVIALQVIEHLSIRQLFEFFYLTFQKLQPGGALVVETVNPESFYALRWFYTDYTHNKPLPAPLTEFLFQYTGYRQVEFFLRSPVEGWRQMAVTGKNRLLDDNFHKLNNLLFGFQDYAIKGIK